MATVITEEARAERLHQALRLRISKLLNEIDYGDMAQVAIDVLGENDSLAKELWQMFNEEPEIVCRQTYLKDQERLAVSIEGVADIHNPEGGEDAIVLLVEWNWDAPVIYVWGDKEQEDHTHEISLRDALAKFAVVKSDNGNAPNN